jgi:hypothetical protein
MLGGGLRPTFLAPCGAPYPALGVSLFSKIASGGGRLCSSDRDTAPLVECSFPNSFWSYAYEPGLLCTEGSVSRRVCKGVRCQGRCIETRPDLHQVLPGVQYRGQHKWKFQVAVADSCLDADDCWLVNQLED